MEIEQIQEIVLSKLGSPPLEMKKMTYGEMNIVYEILLQDRTVMFRANELKQPLAGTKNNIDVLAQLGIPVPTVIYADTSQEKHPFSFMLLDKIPGKDLRFVLTEMSDEELSLLAQQIVSIQKKVATLPLGRGMEKRPSIKRRTVKHGKNILNGIFILACHI